MTGLTLRQQYERTKDPKPHAAEEKPKPAQPADPPILRYWQDAKIRVRITMLGDHEGSYRGIIVYVSRFAIQFDGSYLPSSFSAMQGENTGHHLIILMKHAISTIEAV